MTNRDEYDTVDALTDITAAGVLLTMLAASWVLLHWIATNWR